MLNETGRLEMRARELARQAAEVSVNAREIGESEPSAAFIVGCWMANLEEVKFGTSAAAIRNLLGCYTHPNDRYGAQEIESLRRQLAEFEEMKVGWHKRKADLEAELRVSEKNFAAQIQETEKNDRIGAKYLKELDASEQIRKREYGFFCELKAELEKWRRGEIVFGTPPGAGSILDRLARIESNIARLDTEKRDR